MKGKDIVENLFRFGCIAGAIVALVILLPNSKLVRADKVQVKIPIEKEVTFQRGQEEPKIVDLSEFSFGIPEVGEQATITAKLPVEPKMIQPVLVVNIYHCVLEVYLDGEPIYSYGQEQWEKKQVIGHEYLRIPLPENYGGKTLQMKLLFTEEDSISSLSGIHLANVEESVIAILRDNYLELMTSMTLIVIGFIGLMVSLTRKHFDKDTRTLTWICWFAMGVAVWMLCYSNIITLFVRNPSTCNVLEYFSVYIPGIPSSLFFFNIQKEKKLRYAFGVSAGIFAIWNIVIILLDIFGNIHYIYWVPYMQVAILLLVLLVIFSIGWSLYHKKKEQMVLVYGMGMLSLVSAIELLRFNIFKYVKVFDYGNNSLFPIGAMIFVLTMSYFYFKSSLNNYYDKAQAKIIREMAYKDMLTGVYSRNRCQQLMEQMEEEKKLGYLLTFDLNGLKMANDTYGHARGDEMLKNFATILKKIFVGPFSIGRMGGDEFLVICEGMDENLVMEKLDQVQSEMTSWNTEHPKEQISAAYGYAKYDGTKKMHKVYEIADARMYSCKKEMKESLNPQG